MSRKPYVRPADAVTCDAIRVGEVSIRFVDLGITDERGRKIGARVKMYVMDYVANGKTSGYVQTPGRYYVCDVMTARDGERYGASQADSYHATQAAADAEAARKVEGMRKRYAKKYAR